MSAVERLMKQSANGQHGPVEEVVESITFVVVAAGAGTNSYVLADVARQATFVAQTHSLLEKYGLLPPVNLMHERTQRTTAGLTPKHVVQPMRRILADVQALQERWGTEGLVPPAEPGSRLAGDDAKSAPYHVSHGGTQLLSVATDHLHAIKLLLIDGGVLQNSAPYTLARGALEAAGTAVWMLAPATLLR
jgi:hypothetical protein